MASITLTGIQANTSLHQDQENVALLQRLREVMQHHQDPEKGFQHLRAIFLQRATSFLTVFVDESQQRTLTDVRADRPLTPLTSPLMLTPFSLLCHRCCSCACCTSWAARV